MKYIPNAMKFGSPTRSSLLIINMIWYATFTSGCSPAFYRVAVLKNFKSHKNVMESFFKIKTPKGLKEVMKSFFNIKNFKSHEKVMESFFGIKICKTVMVSFFSIKNFKSRKKVMEFFFSINNFNSRKNVTEPFFSGHASLCFHDAQIS